jgi:hypothetical protein
LKVSIFFYRQERNKVRFVLGKKEMEERRKRIVPIVLNALPKSIEETLLVGGVEMGGGIVGVLIAVASFLIAVVGALFSVLSTIILSSTSSLSFPF